MPIITLLPMFSPASIWKRIKSRKYRIWYERSDQGFYYIFYTNSWGMFHHTVRKFIHLSYNHSYWVDVWYYDEDFAQWFVDKMRTIEDLKAYREKENEKARKARLG